MGFKAAKAKEASKRRQRDACLGSYAPSMSFCLISSLALFALAPLTPPLLAQGSATMDFTGLGPAPLDDPELMHKWGNKARDKAGCTVAESAWQRVIDDYPGSEWTPPSLYNIAVCHELSNNFQKALNVYERLAKSYPNDPVMKDSLFRQGIVLETLGRHKEAAKLYQNMLRNLELRLSLSDKVACAIQRDINALNSKHERKSVRRLLKHLEAYEGASREEQEPLHYWIAKLQLALGQYLSQTANSIPVSLNSRQILRAKVPGKSESDLLSAQLDERGKDLLAARSRYQSAIAMQIPEWSVAAIYHMAWDHEVLYRDLVAAPIPRGLNAEEAETYSHSVMDKSYPILVKAYRLYRHGHEVSRNHQDKSQWTFLIEERITALDLEGVSVDPGN